MSMSTPAISVLMPVCNAGRFLASALESVLTQTFSDFELIAIDDGSRDESGKVLAEYAARDPRIRVFGQDNQGIVATLNGALELGARAARRAYGCRRLIAAGSVRQADHVSAESSGGGGRLGRAGLY